MRARNGGTGAGRLFIIGGHEVRDGKGIVLARIAQLIGGGKLVVVTMASEEPDETYKEYNAAFRAHGTRHRYHLRIESRQDAASKRALGILRGADCVFFTGGDQLRITGLLGDSPVYHALYELMRGGCLIAGTSAGASALTETMMVSGDAESSHRVHANLELAPGLGFVRHMVIDQHFAERGRIGRLLGVLGQNPRVLGVGIDENTAIDLKLGRSFQVVGEGGVTVLDGRGVTLTGVTATDTGRTMSLFGVGLHLLSQSDEFDVLARRPIPKAHEELDDATAAPRGAGSRAPRTARPRRGARSRGGTSSRRSRRAGGSA